MFLNFPKKLSIVYDDDFSLSVQFTFLKIYLNLLKIVIHYLGLRSKKLKVWSWNKWTTLKSRNLKKSSFQIEFWANLWYFQATLLGKTVTFSKIHKIAQKLKCPWNEGRTLQYFLQFTTEQFLIYNDVHKICNLWRSNLDALQTIYGNT